jgi:hypothetical protein
LVTIFLTGSVTLLAPDVVLTSYARRVDPVGAISGRIDPSLSTALARIAVRRRSSERLGQLPWRFEALDERAADEGAAATRLAARAPRTDASTPLGTSAASPIRKWREQTSVPLPWGPSIDIKPRKASPRVPLLGGTQGYPIKRLNLGPALGHTAGPFSVLLRCRPCVGISDRHDPSLMILVAG